jgi:hypothetical protein
MGNFKHSWHRFFLMFAVACLGLLLPGQNAWAQG